jgi:uncharacterized membrane protein (DUF4010 family)
MTPASTELEATVRLAIAGLIGLGVGLEREWSGHASGEHARFAGLRTLFLLGLVGGVAGLWLAEGRTAAAAVVLGGGMALAVAAYVVATRRPGADVDGTTEAAAIAVVVLGAVAGGGWLALAAGVGSVAVLALVEKSRLHWLVRRVGERELRAALLFAVLALVVLPLLPRGPFGGALEIRPRALWSITLFLSVLSFAGFLARRAVGPGAGYAMTGMLGGLISSTAVTLEFARTSRREPALSGVLGYGVVGACTVLLPRVVVVSAVLSPDVGLRVALLLLPAALVGGALMLFARGRAPDTTHTTAREESGSQEGSPLGLRAAAQMAIVFQLSLSAIGVVLDRWGSPGLYPTASVLGLTDVDALTASMSRIDAGISAETAARAIAVGIVANTALKIGIAAVLGRGRFRRVAIMGLLALGLAVGLALFFAAW